MEVIHKDVKDLTASEYRAFHAANFGDTGIMRGELERCKKYNLQSSTISIWTGIKRRRLVGWALVTPVRGYGDLAASRHTMKVSKYTFQFWVKPQYRGKGYGKLLMQEAYRLDPRPHVMPHDEKSEKFFSHYHVMVMQIDRNWRDEEL